MAERKERLMDLRMVEKRVELREANLEETKGNLMVGMMELL